VRQVSETAWRGRGRGGPQEYFLLPRFRFRFRLVGIIRPFRFGFLSLYGSTLLFLTHAWLGGISEATFRRPGTPVHLLTYLSLTAEEVSEHSNPVQVCNVTPSIVVRTLTRSENISILSLAEKETLTFFVMHFEVDDVADRSCSSIRHWRKMRVMLRGCLDPCA
jgi:hypothetical protein